MNISIDNEKRVLEINSSDNFMEAIKKFCNKNNLSEESRKVIIKNVMKELYQKRIERKYSGKKVRLNSRQVNELIREFRSWEEEVEARVKVILHKYDVPVINEYSKRIVELKRLAKQSVYKRLYNSAVISSGLHFRYSTIKANITPTVKRQSATPNLYRSLIQIKEIEENTVQSKGHSLPRKSITIIPVQLAIIIRIIVRTIRSSHIKSIETRNL